MRIIFLLILTAFSFSVADYTPKELKCEVCKATIEEMVYEISKVNPKKKIQIGGYKIDASGNLQEKLISYARSGMHLSELMDRVCTRMNDFVRAYDKKTRKLILLELMTKEGGMNPMMSEVDIIQDSDLNKSLEYYCEGIVEEFEDEIYEELKEPSEDPVTSICTYRLKFCEIFDVNDEL